MGAEISIGTDGRMTLYQGNAMRGKLAPINKTIIIHPDHTGNLCPMSRARVAETVLSCPLGCNVPSVAARDPGITTHTMTDQIFTLLSERESLLGRLIGVYDHAGDNANVNIRGHQYDTDRIIISINGGAQEFTLTITENK